MNPHALPALLLSLVIAFAAAPSSAGESMAASVRLNVRGGPGLDHEILDTLTVGERVLVNDCRGDWCRITHVGIDGWVFAPYLVAASFTQSWRAISRHLPATIYSDNASPDIGVTVELDPRRRCPSTHPFC